MIDLFIDYFYQSFGFNLEQLLPVALAQKYLDEDIDTQYDKAIEVLKEKMAKQ